MVNALSLIPPLLAIALCFATKNVLMSLFAAIVAGSVIANGWNFIAPIIDTYMVNGIKSNTSVIVGMLFLGMMLSFIRRAGGYKGFAEFCQKKLNSERRTLISTFWFSCCLFISGYLANLCLPRVMRVPARENRMPIMKVPMIITSVCSALSTMTPITMYILFFSGLIVSAVEGYDGMTLYISSIPFMFYAVVSLIFAAGYAYGLIPDIGPVRRLTAGVKAGELDIFGRKTGDETNEENDLSIFGGPETPSDVWALFAPVIGMVAAIVILSLANGSIVVNPAFLVGAAVAAVYALVKKAIRFADVSGLMVGGVRDQAGLLCILVFAYAFGQIVSELGFNAFVVEIVGNNFSAGVVPLIAFVICCIISYGTGSLSAAAVIVFPMAVPLALATGAPIALTIGACVSGSHFGDLPSPVSDNIIMPSEAAGISPVELSRALLPYRLIQAVICCVAFFAAGCAMV
ncbi:MAG: Na+/H+ antiporter NhaC family protein [Clostridiales bacterium]|nr:Na+/H+ antiporter NhaC family protein [Clostridiales bacterium]